MIKHGFSLLELLIVLSIASIVIAIATPHWQTFLEHHHLTQQSKQLLYELRAAKALALASQKTITFGFRLSPSSQQQWFYFFDHNKNRKLDDGEVTIAETTLRPFIHLNHFYFGQKKNIQLTPQGYLADFTNGRVTLTHKTSQESAKIIFISRLGKFSSNFE